MALLSEPDSRVSGDPHAWRIMRKVKARVRRRFFDNLEEEAEVSGRLAARMRRSRHWQRIRRRA